MALSAALWYAAHRQTSPLPRHVTIAAGPGPPGARDEAEAVAAIYQTTALHGPAATVQAVTAALNRADLVHLAAHGRVRADNPLFSSLSLADGPLTVFDLERLDRVAPMAAGLDAASALSQAQRQLADGGSRAMAAAAGFICIGAGMKASALPSGPVHPPA